MHWHEGSRRRTPLGGLPNAHRAIRASEAGLVILPSESLLPSFRAFAPHEQDIYIVRVTAEVGTQWAVRVYGTGVPSAFDGSDEFELLRPRIKRRPGSAQDVPLHKLLPEGPYVAADTKIKPYRDYLDVATYDEDVLPINDLLVITDDTAVVFGWLSSKAFWVWQQMVREQEPSANTHRAYNTFPAPHLSRKQQQQLEIAVDTVLRARSYALDNDLAVLYREMPRGLRDAHEELDGVANELLGLPRDATTAQISEHLEKLFDELIAA